MTMKFVLFYLMIGASVPCVAQTKNHIYYDLPKSINTRVRDHIDHYLSKGTDTDFVADLSENTDGRYLLSIIDYKKGSGPKVFGLLYSEVINKSNRMLKIGKYTIPIITSEDMIFADLGETKMPDGRVAKKRVIMNFDGYTITFDRSGKIYEH